MAVYSPDAATYHEFFRRNSFLVIASGQLLIAIAVKKVALMKVRIIDQKSNNPIVKKIGKFSIEIQLRYDWKKKILS